VRLTIERLRTLVLVSGALLIVALIGFLALGRWKSRLILKEIPHRLGADIQRQANGFVYTQSHGGHTLFKIRASQVVQLKKDGRAQLHDVEIELYGQDGSVVDRIKGGEFEYDQKAGTATAAGPVEITITRPTEAPVVAPGAKPQLPARSSPLSNAANEVASGQIAVKTSGLTFDQKTGVATTAQRVEFAVVQGQGSSTGATFDSNRGQLVLDRDVELNVRRGAETIVLRAAHGEFERTQSVCNLTGAAARYSNGQAAAGRAQVTFRGDGSAERLDAHDGFTLTNAQGAKIAAPNGSLDFNEKNQPTQGKLEGGVTMESSRADRSVRGAAPTALLAFTPDGQLKHAHLERGVTLHSEQSGPGVPHVVRDWRSPVADLDFRSGGNGQLQMATVKGTGGVVIMGQSQKPGGPVAPSWMAADQVTGEFGAHEELTRITGMGHATLDQTTTAGAHQTTGGDRLVAVLTGAERGQASGQVAGPVSGRGDLAQQIQSATIDGNVVITQQKPAKAGEGAQPDLRATAGHAQYDGGSEWLHLTESPRIDDGALQLTADKLDISQASGDAFAHGNVKATWLDVANGKPGRTAAGGLAFGGQGPAHVIASEAQMQRDTGAAAGEITFRGQARLWQEANSVSAPVIVLNQSRQTLVARGAGSGQPVNLVLLSSGGAQGAGKTKVAKTNSAPSVVRVRAGDLKYSGAERKAILHAGAAGQVVAESAEATTSSNEVELVLLPPGNHAGPDGSAAQLDHLTARGNVVVTSNGRRGTGDQLVYSGETGQYVLTGAAGAPPKMTDPVHGSVTGEALIFNSRDDSVSVEGQGHKTLTQTVAPK
jgi:lipopolysaccharide export system protein LptA